MRILWVGTKAPVPPLDGGRQVALTTLRALAAAGHAVTVVAPVAPAAYAATGRACRAAGIQAELVAVRPVSWPRAARAAVRQRLPLAIARHAHAALAASVDRLLDAEPFDVVHVEQLQALTAGAGAARRAVPIVLRAQNVESELWDTGPALARWEARRLARWEGTALRRVATTIALTTRDAERLAALAGPAARVRRIAAPFPATGLGPGPLVDGVPAVVLPASGGWPPNDDAVAWFVRAVWPRVRARLPEARLHLFGAHARRATDAIVAHARPAESAALFPANAVVVVPLRRAIGVRMRILEAWARGVPAVATPAAAAGLDPGAERALAIAADPDTLADALVALAADASARARLVAAGAAFLRTYHDPATVAAALAGAYAEVVRAARARR